MEFDLGKFREAPTEEQLFHCSKAQLMSIVEHYGIETVSVSLKKYELRARVVTALIRQGVPLSESEDLDLSDGSKSEVVKLQTQDVQSVHLQELELQFKIKQLEIEAKDKEEGRKFEMARLQLVHEERMKELEMRSFEMQSQSARSHIFCFSSV
ncbi:unnamed protein product [Arctogadus glacialis]